MQSDQVVVEVTGSAVAVVPDAVRPPAAMPAAPRATTLVDVVLADASGRAVFERMPQLTLRIEDTTPDRLMAFLAMPDGTAAVLRLLEVDGGAELVMTIPDVGTRVMLLAFASSAEAEDFARRFDARTAPRPEPAPEPPPEPDGMRGPGRGGRGPGGWGRGPGGFPMAPPPIAPPPPMAPPRAEAPAAEAPIEEPAAVAPAARLPPRHPPRHPHPRPPGSCPRSSTPR